MNNQYRTRLCILMAASLLIRALAAGLLELGNDEVYYWTYALFPDWSHFDHPPMLGWVIRLFTLNLTFDSELALRMPSLVLGTFNTWLIFQLGRLIKNERTGWYAALLYTASVYATILTGTFILPDTPLGTFYLTALFFFFKALDSPVHFLTAGLFTGLAMLSKYSGVFLWVGAGLYLLCYRRKLFRSPFLWGGLAVSLLLFLPVVFWNMNRDMTSFAFHTERVAFFGEGLKLFYFGREVFGEILYNNPVNTGLIVWAVWTAAGSFRVHSAQPAVPVTVFRMLMTQAIPLLSIFLFFSLFRETLPHWSAPAYYSLVLLASCALDAKLPVTFSRIPAVIMTALGITLVVIFAGTAEILTGFVALGKNDSGNELGRTDFTLDMYGWKQLSGRFGEIKKEQEILYEETDGALGMPKNAAILSYRWFPAAHLDYYVARPNGTVVKTEGPLAQTHKYESITQLRGGIDPQERFYRITSSRYADPPGVTENMQVLDTFYVNRNRKPVIRYIIRASK